MLARLGVVEDGDMAAVRSALASAGEAAKRLGSGAEALAELPGREEGSAGGADGGTANRAGASVVGLGLVFDVVI